MNVVWHEKILKEKQNQFAFMTLMKFGEETNVGLVYRSNFSTNIGIKYQT
jgi:hypothetical protein